MSALDNKISEIETAGKKVDKSYYKSQKNVNNKELAKYKAEKTALKKSLKNIKEGTDEWYDAKDAIQEVDNVISDCVKTTYELNNAINQLHFDLFDDVSDGIKRIITEQEFLQGLFAHEKNADNKTGNLTEAGIAKLGSLSASYYASKENADRDKAMLKSLQNVKSKGKQKDGTYKLGKWTFNSLDDLQEKIDEVYTKWQDDIKETYSLESGIVDVMKEKYQAELDLLKELIDARKEALNTEKDLHDYQKSLNEKTRDITTLQKQIAAYSGDTSQEGMAKLQKLQKELSDKEDDLKETEYDKYISDQESMLDKLYDEYNKKLEEKLENFMLLVEEGLGTANKNMAIIEDYLKNIAKNNGYDPETKGLHDSSSGDIKDNVGAVAEKVEKEETKLSGTQSSVWSNNTDNKPTEAKSFAVAEAKSSTTITDAVKDYISKHASKAKKDKKEYSAVNQAIYSNKSKAYKGSGKVLSLKELKGLAKNVFGIKYDNASKKGSLYKKLKSIGFPGFKKGGVVSVDDIEKQVHENGDTGLVSVKNGEGILTPVQTEMFQNFVKNMDKYQPVVQLPNPLDNLRAISEARSMNNVVNIDMGGITMNGVDNPKEFVDGLLPEFQRNKGFERLLDSMTNGRLAGAGSLNKYRHRF